MITTLSQLIAKSESNSTISAVRFEPAYHPDTRAFSLAQKAMPGLSYATYEMFLACSFGLYQIMGDNLYLLGLDKPLSVYWNDADMQADFFNRFCTQRRIAYSLTEVINDPVKGMDLATIITATLRASIMLDSKTFTHCRRRNVYCNNIG